MASFLFHVKYVQENNCFPFSSSFFVCVCVNVNLHFLQIWHVCVCDQGLYMDGVQLFPEHLQEFADLMTEKELRLRLPLEELDILLED